MVSFIVSSPVGTHQHRLHRCLQQHQLPFARRHRLLLYRIHILHSPQTACRRRASPFQIQPQLQGEHLPERHQSHHLSGHVRVDFLTLPRQPDSGNDELEYPNVWSRGYWCSTALLLPRLLPVRRACGVCEKRCLEAHRTKVRRTTLWHSMMFKILHMHVDFSLY